MRNKKIYWCGIIVIALTLVASFCFISFIRLKEPVFFRYCIEVTEIPQEAGDFQIMELQYITNSDDSRNIIGIRFLQAPEFQFNASESPLIQSTGFMFSNTTQLKGEIIGRYSLRKAYVYMTNYQPELLKNGLELNQAQITMSDGSSYTSDLGRIVLFGGKEMDQTFSQSYISSSTGYTSTSLYTVEGDTTLLELQSPLMEDVKGVLEFSINEVDTADFFPTVLKQGANLTIESKFTEFTEEDYDQYDIRPRLIYSKEDGSQGYMILYNNTWNRYFDGFWDLFHYLNRTREVL